MSARCHYCTHYSSAIIVSSFLVRMEPFSHTFQALQVRPDRPVNENFNIWYVLTPGLNKWVISKLLQNLMTDLIIIQLFHSSLLEQRYKTCKTMYPSPFTSQFFPKKYTEMWLFGDKMWKGIGGEELKDTLLSLKMNWHFNKNGIKCCYYS